MNELLAQAYGTDNNITANQSVGMEKSAEAALLEELEKVAAAEGIDLGEFSDDDIIEILTEAMGSSEEQEKTAEAAAPTSGVAPAGGVASEDDQVKLAEADFLGRTMAHAFYDELTSIQSTGSDQGVTKTAADGEYQQAFEGAAVERANQILDAVGIDPGTGKEKASSAGQSDDDVENALTERAGQLLADAGYNVDAIAQALNG